MIGRLRGLLVHKSFNSAIVECGGVGYLCSISLGTYGALPEEGHEAILHVETLLRENDLSLLGFATKEEQQLYRLLVKVDGVGPKLALAALGALPLADLVEALRSRDVKRPTSPPPSPTWGSRRTRCCPSSGASRPTAPPWRRPSASP